MSFVARMTDPSDKLSTWMLYGKGNHHKNISNLPSIAVEKIENICKLKIKLIETRHVIVISRIVL